VTEKQIRAAIKKAKGNRTQAAEALGISRGAMYHQCKKYGISPKSTAVKFVEEDDRHRQMRKVEAQNRKLKEQLKAEIARRKTAELDIEEMLERDNVLTEASERQAVSRQLAHMKEGNKSSGGCTAIICASDWHLEKNIVPSTVSGLNEFNLSIGQKRIDRLWQKSVYLVEFFKHIADVDDVVLWLGGDLINNYLHDEDVEGNLCGPTEAIALLQDHVCSGIDFLSDHVNLSRVICNYGNHGRTTHRMRYATGWKTSWEYLAYVTIQRCNPGLDFQIAQGYFNYAKIQGYNVRFHHGDSVRYSGGVGGLSIPMNKAIQQWDKGVKAKLSINGHYHQYLDYWSWVSCGCLCGYDAFAQSIKAEYQEPTQTIIFLDKSRGKVESMPIFVEKPRKKLYV